MNENETCQIDKKIPKIPTASELGSLVKQALMKTVFVEIIKKRSVHEIPTDGKKAFTKFMSDIAKHPFLLRFSQHEDRLPHSVSLAKDAAVNDLVTVVYHVMWHLKIKFPMVRVKGANEDMSVVHCFHD